jgi:hypothetical protein
MKNNQRSPRAVDKLGTGNSGTQDAVTSNVGTGGGLRAARYGWVALLALLFVGCKDQAKCDDALKTARQAMQDEFLDMDLARKWRDFGGKICGAGPALDALDKEIVDREAALLKAADDKAKAEAAAGKSSVDASAKLWKKFDKLEDKEKTPAALKKLRSKVNKLLVGLAPAYAEQVKKYNDKEYQKRESALKAE